MEAMEAERVRERPGLDLAGTARAKTVYAAGGAVEAEVTRGDWSHVEWRACADPQWWPLVNYRVREG